MENIQTARVVKVGTSLALILPVAICRSMQLGRGDRFVFGIYDDNIFYARRLTTDDLRNIKPPNLSI